MAANAVIERGTLVLVRLQKNMRLTVDTNGNTAYLRQRASNQLTTSDRQR